MDSTIDVSWRRRLGARFVIVALVASVMTAAVATNGAAAAPPTPGIPTATGPVMSLANSTFSVPVDGSGARRVQFVAQRSPRGQHDWSDGVNLLPYYDKIIVTSGSVAQIEVPAATFQGGYDYRVRARQWSDGQGNDPSGWSGWFEFEVAADPASPVAPYPISPQGDTPPSGNILTVDGSALPNADNDPIASYEVQVRTIHEPFRAGADDVTAWSAVVPFQGAGNPVEVALDNCQSIPDCTGTGTVSPSPSDPFGLRFRARSIDDQGATSAWSRWRYFTTVVGPDDTASVPNRAGSYQAGGDEASGLAASKTYPGIYWFIRDAGGDTDRAVLYAIEIDPVTRRLDNIDGTVTRAIPVQGAVNTDWESIAADDSGNLWVGDIGDYYRKDDPGLPPSEAAGQHRDRNNSAEPDVALLRIPEPNPYTATSATVTKLAPFQYPDGSTHDSEALLWLDGWMFLVTKETDRQAQIYRFPSYISRTRTDNTLRYVGEVSARLDPITGIDINEDNELLVMTTASKRAVIYNAPGTTPTSSSEADDIVRSILVEDEPAYHYFYRDAAALETEGRLDERSEADRQTTMQIEGVALHGSDLAMISEFGEHVLYVGAEHPTEFWGWNQLIGSGTPDGEIVGINDPAPPAGTFITPGSTWHYRDSGVRPSGFEFPSYATSADWETGAAPLGALDGDEATTLNHNEPYHRTDYFRRPFNVGDAAAVTSLDLELLVDDGAIVYLNGQPVVRHNMPLLPPTNSMTALQAVWGSAEDEIHAFHIDAPALVDGVNWIAVEVHQAQDSHDRVFDLRLSAG